MPIVDEFVARHPEFSADGAKGVLAVTGYEGVLGERVDDRTAPDWPATVKRAKALAARLRATGWTFASHSYAHDDETKISVAKLIHDSKEWQTEDEPIVGPTDVYVYPYGAGFPLDSPQIGVLRDFGFTILCDIDVVGEAHARQRRDGDDPAPRRRSQLRGPTDRARAVLRRVDRRRLRGAWSSLVSRR